MVRNRLGTAVAVVAVVLVVFGLVMGALSKNADPNPTVDTSPNAAIGPAHGIETTTTTEAPSTTADRGTYTSGDGTKLPEGWPAEVKIPSGVTLTSTSKAALTMQATGELQVQPRTAYDEMHDSLLAAGYQISASSFTPSFEGGFGTMSASNDRYNVSLYVGPDSDRVSAKILTITVGDQD